MFKKRMVAAVSAVGLMVGLAVAATPATATQVNPPVPNPPLTAKCGLDFALILDSSGSIGEEGMEMLTLI